MSVVPIRRKNLGDLIHTRLTGIPSLVVFRGEIPAQPPMLMNGPNPDPSHRVAKHLIWFGGAGDPVVEADLADFNTELAWSFTTICVAAFLDDCIDLVDQVHARLYRWVPVLEDHAFGPVKPPPGFDPGAVRRIDRNGLPPRYELPLLWQLQVTTS